MERSRKMDATGPAAARVPLIRVAVVSFFFLAVLVGLVHSQTIGSQLEQIKQLTARQRWQEVVNLAESSPSRSADLDFYYATALANLDRWQDAARIFKEGRRLAPNDERFPVELAGIEFKQKNYPQAAALLRRALELAPNDSYATNFLASVYFLAGNLEAALKYWNRQDKPTISAIRMEPMPRVNAALLDRAFTFAPASTLLLPDLLTSRTRVEGLGIFPFSRFDLLAREDGAFDLMFRNQERDGWGNGPVEILLGLFRRLPAQTVTPEYLNFRHEAINFTSSFRWDAQKRRILAGFSAPFGGNPKRRYRLGIDLRNENWNLLTSFTGPAQELGTFNLLREAASAEFTSFSSGRWNWSAGAELSHRDFRSILPGPALSANLLAEGLQLKQSDRLNVSLWRVPERRIDLSATASTEFGRVWSQPSHSFAKLQGSLLFHWLPRALDDDYEMQNHIFAGKTFGGVPVDELYVFGVWGDNDLWMRGHIATRDGKKGSGPMGRQYFLSNWEIDKKIFSKAGVNLKLGPFVDTGAMADDAPALGSHKWLCDMGAQLKIRVLGVGVGVMYGTDLRSGNHALTAVQQ